MADAFPPPSAPAPRPWQGLLLAFAALAIVALLGAGAIALERPTGAASGRVLSAEDGTPLPNARVTLAGPVTRTLVTGPDGTYRFHRLPVGSYHAVAKERTHDPQWHEAELAIAEGQSVDSIDFKLARTVPALEVANVQRVFMPSEDVRLHLRGTQVTDAAVKLYKLDLDRAVGSLDDLEAMRTPNVAAWEARGVIAPLKNWQTPIRRPEGGEDNWFHQSVQMPPLAPGAYLATFSGAAEPGAAVSKPGALKRTYWFTVSRLAVVTKRAEGMLLAYGVDLVSKQPVPGVRFSFFGPGGRLGAATADQSGLARFAATSDSPVLVKGDAAGSTALARTWFYGSASPYRIYAYTERPVYRPGQTVHYKGLVRAERLARYKSAAGATVRLVARDAKGVVVQDTRASVGANSAFDGSLTLHPDAPLGEYLLELTIGEQTYEQISFQVSDYRKPEFKIDLTPAKARYAQGETAEVALSARYYFGAPVPNARLLVTVYAAPDYGDRDAEESFYDGFTDEAGVEPFWGYGDVIHQVEAEADAEGNYRLSVPLEPGASREGWSGDHVYTIAVEGTDASRRPIKATGSFLVTQGAFKLSVETGQSLYTGDRKLDLRVVARDYEQKPVRTQVEVEVVRLDAVDKQTADGDLYVETVRKTVFRGLVTTDAEGRASLSAPTTGAGSYEVTASARDAAGRRVLDAAWAWVAAPGESLGASSYGALRIVLDRKRYKPGETARALIVSPVPDLSVLLSVEGTKLHSARVIRLEGHSALVTLLVTEAHQPNAFVAAAAVNGKELLSAERSLNVLPEQKFLNVSVSSDKSRYEPGETARYTIETRDWQNKPVAADVSLGVVDQAIYAIEPEKTSDIRAFFHGPRWNSVRTTHSFAEDYSGGLDKFAPDPRVRARLEDTAAWFPSLRTGPDGRATVSVALPDNLTTWVATARAATLATQVGSARHTMLASKDLLVRLDAPRFVVQGDRFELAATAHNYTETDQRIALTLMASGLVAEGDGNDARLATVPPGDARRERWRVRVEAPGTVGATATAKGQTDADALRLGWPALPFGVARFAAVSGVAGDAPGAQALELPPDAVPGTPRLLVQLHPSSLPAILAAVDYLHGFEYGCVEQTMSRFLPDVALPPRLSRVGAPVGQRFDDRAERTAEGVRRLVSMQQGDGGWGWWSHDESKPELTSYVLYGLAEAREAGASVPADAVKRAVAYLKRRLPAIERDVYTRFSVQRDAGADARAFALFALARWGEAPPKELDRLWAERERLSPYGRAQFALALAPGQRRTSLIDSLARSAAVSETQAHWASDARAYAWQDSTVETTAYALRALNAERPDDPLVPKAVRWLESQNQGGRWASTKDTVAAAITLAETLDGRGRGRGATAAGAVVSVNGVEVGRYAPDPGDAWAAPAPIRVDSALKQGRNELTVRRLGEGQLDYTAALSWMAGGERLQPESAHGLAIQRDYFVLPALVHARLAGEPWKLHDEKLVSGLERLGERVRAGQRVLVRLSVTNERPLSFMAFEDPLPAGCEVLDAPVDRWGYWWDHQEFRDQKAAFFSSRLPVGTHRFYYVVRPTIQGAFRALPASAWAMYAPEVRASTGDRRLIIQE